jgi:hypothetical protein
MRLHHKHVPPPHLLREVTLRDELQSVRELLTTEENLYLFESLINDGASESKLDPTLMCFGRAISAAQSRAGAFT